MRHIAVDDDDDLFIDDDLLAGDLINCGAGSDLLSFTGADFGATIRNCEPPPP